MRTMIKQVLKNTPVYQFKRCVDTRAKTIGFMRGIPRHVAWKVAAAKTRPVFLNNSRSDAKIRQYERLFKKVHISFDVSTDFLYWIDESTVPFHKHLVIENMPMDYSWVVDYSLIDLEHFQKITDNSISIQNHLFLRIIRLYMQRIARAVSDSKFSEDLKNRHLQFLKNMEVAPAMDMKEALWRILIWNQFLWQSGHTLNGLGRLDKILDRFPVEEDGDRIIKEFLRLLHEHYAFKSNEMLGDTGQIILLGGIEEHGNYFCNDYSYLFLNMLSKLSIPDPKILLRVSEKMPDELLKTAENCISSRCGSPLLSNDDVVIPSLESFGYSHTDACNYGVSACWEPLVIGKSLEQNNMANINFATILEQMVNNPRFTDCVDFLEMLELYRDCLNHYIDGIFEKLDHIRWEREPFFTLFTEGCITSGKDISEGGAIYNDYGILSVGLASAVDSLLNINQYILKNKIITQEQLRNIMNNNYENNKHYQKLFSQSPYFFGKDDEASIWVTKRIMSYVEEKLFSYRNPLGGKVKFGLSSPSYVNEGKETGATADGRYSGEPFKTHISSGRGVPPSSIVCFAGHLDYKGVKSNGNVVDLVLQPSFVDKQYDRFLAFLKGSIQTGFFQMQFNIVSYKQLLDAKVHPEKYKNLIVRVWGFSAYFNDLPEEYKDALIARAKESECD